MTVDFFQHDTCIGNELQRKVLEDAGFELNVYSILDINWKKHHLGLFFKGSPVETWFDYNAVSIKEKRFDPQTVSEQDALEYMLQDRFLIKRPLIHFNGEYCAGFESELVQRMLSHSKDVSAEVIRNGGLCANFKSWKQYRDDKNV